MTYIMPTYFDGSFETESIHLVDVDYGGTLVSTALKNMFDPYEVDDQVVYIDESFVELKEKTSIRIAKTYFTKDCVTCPCWHNGQKDEYYGCKSPTGACSCSSFLGEQARLLKTAERRIKSVCSGCGYNCRCPMESKGNSCSSDSKKIDRFRCLNFLLKSHNISLDA